MRKVAILGLMAALLAAGCGSSAKTSSSSATQARTAISGHAAAPPNPNGNGGVTAPASTGGGAQQPVPGAAATLSVTPLTTAPGHSITVVLHAPAGTREAVATLSGTGGKTGASMHAGAGGFVTTLAVPATLQGGFWPVTASYGATSLSHSVSTQVKVFTP